LSIGAGQLSPGGRKFGLVGQTIIEKHRELLRLERVQWRVLVFRPPANTALRKTTGKQIEADAVVAQHFEGSAAAISKYK